MLAHTLLRACPVPPLRAFGGRCWRGTGLPALPPRGRRCLRVITPASASGNPAPAPTAPPARGHSRHDALPSFQCWGVTGLLKNPAVTAALCVYCYLTGYSFWGFMFGFVTFAYIRIMVGARFGW